MVLVASNVPEKLPSENVPPMLLLKNSPPPDVMFVVSPLKIKVKSPDQAVSPTVPLPVPLNV